MIQNILIQRHEYLSKFLQKLYVIAIIQSMFSVCVCFDLINSSQNISDSLSIYGLVNMPNEFLKTQGSSSDD